MVLESKVLRNLCVNQETFHWMVSVLPIAAFGLIKNFEFYIMDESRNEHIRKGFETYVLQFYVLFF